VHNNVTKMVISGATTGRGGPLWQTASGDGVFFVLDPLDIGAR